MPSTNHSSRPEFPGGALAGPLSIRDLSALLERLPTSERAALAWAPAALEQAIQPLREGPLTHDVVVSCSVGVFRVLGELFPSLVKLLGAERFFSEVDGASTDALDRLRASLPDAGSKRSADWVVRAFQRFAARAAEASPQELAAVEAHSAAEAAFVEFLHRDAAGVLRAIVLLVAAMSIADQGGDPERAAELCDLAFLDAARAVAYLAPAGLAIASESLSTPGNRGRAILETVDEARAALGAEDIDALSRFRLHDLR